MSHINGHQMEIERKREIVRKVLSVAKGCTILKGEKLVNHVANSITLYEKPIKK